MNIQRIWAITLRHLRQVVKDIPRLSMLFYWSFIELMIIGFMGVWVDSSSHNGVAIPLIAAAIGWSLIVRTSLEVSWNLLEELWAHNLVNLFASPLTIGEWMASAALYSVFSFVALFFFLWGCAYALFSYSFVTTGWILVPLVVNYYLSAMVIGFLTASLLIRCGLRVTSYVFMVSWVFAPLSGIYYSISVLPIWARYIAYILPTYYGVDVLKVYVASGVISYARLGYATFLNIFYLCAVLVLFKYMYEKSRQEGLTRLVH